MAVTDRPLFGNTSFNSRGTGITSGLDTEDNRLGQLFEQQQNILQSIRPPTQEFNKFQAASPALLTLGANLLSGRSFQGGLGGALDILVKQLARRHHNFLKLLKQAVKQKLLNDQKSFN